MWVFELLDWKVKEEKELYVRSFVDQGVLLTFAWVWDLRTAYLFTEFNMVQRVGTTF